MTTPAPQTFNEWLEAKYPPPTEDEPGYAFYRAWGYDQVLIKATGKDMEQLAILLRPQYMAYVMAVFLDGRMAQGAAGADIFVGLPLVRTLRALYQFPFTSVARGFVGVRVSTVGNADLVCIPVRAKLYIDYVAHEQLEDLGAVMTTETDFLSRQEGFHPALPGDLQDTFCTVPGLNDGQPVWVGKVLGQSIGNPWHCDVFWAPANTFVKADGAYKPPAARYRNGKLHGKYWNPPAPMVRTNFQWTPADQERLEIANVLAVIQESKVAMLDGGADAASQ